MGKLNKTRKMAGVALCVAIAVSAQAAPKRTPKVAPKPVPKLVHLESAYFAGRVVKFHSEPANDGRALVVGPWNLGQKISPGPSDKRPNLYFVSPGTLHRVAGKPEFDHNEVLSAVPDGESSFDVFWVVVLDPSVKEDFTSEQQIILATQQTFSPGENFSFDQIPSVGFLRTFLKIHDMEGLEKYKRPDGELPKVAIVRAGFTLKATAEEQQEQVKSAAAEGPE
jgi:hypothetical protein